MRERSSLLIGLLAAAVHIPGVVIPLWGDELVRIREAALNLQDASRFLTPWIGGVFRPLPKLAIMGGLAAWGVRAWPFHLVAILLHAICSVYVARLAEKWSSSRLVGVWAGVLFAVGFGAYGPAVHAITNITMLIALALLLAALDMLWRGRRASALVLFILAASSHEFVAVAPALIPFMVPLRNREHGLPGEALLGRHGWTRETSRVLGVSLIVLVLLGFLPGVLGRFCSTEVGMSGFMLVPVNRGSAAAAGAGSALVDLVDALASNHFWIGAVVTLCVAFVLRRRHPLRALSAAWIYLYLLPPAVLMFVWDRGWWQRRYLYVAAVGVCLLASHLILRLHRRSRALAFVVLTVLVVWSLSLGALTWRKMLADSLSPQQVHFREVCFTEIGRLNPRWVPPPD